MARNIVIKSLYILICVCGSIFFSLFFPVGFTWAYAISEVVGDSEPSVNQQDGPETASETGWTSFDEIILGETFSDSQTTGTGEPSVNQGEAGPFNEVPQVPPMVHYPYHHGDIIGGESVDIIQQRLLSNLVSLSFEDIQLAKHDAEDLFEVKVDIIRTMTGLDPIHDWLGRGTRALENKHTRTGEPRLEDLYKWRDDLNAGGIQSETFSYLKDRMIYLHPIDQDGDADSSA